MRRPRAELVGIIGRLLEDKALEKGEEYEYTPIESVELIPNSVPEKGDVPFAVATLVGNIKELPLEDLKHVLSVVCLA